jgi:hypothetical protein
MIAVHHRQAAEKPAVRPENSLKNPMGSEELGAGARRTLQASVGTQHTIGR